MLGYPLTICSMNWIETCEGREEDLRISLTCLLCSLIWQQLKNWSGPACSALLWHLKFQPATTSSPAICSKLFCLLSEKIILSTNNDYYRGTNYILIRSCYHTELNCWFNKWVNVLGVPKNNPIYEMGPSMIYNIMKFMKWWQRMMLQWFHQQILAVTRAENVGIQCQPSCQVVKRSIEIWRSFCRGHFRLLG